MRIVCFHPARDPVACGQGPVHVGSAAEDTVVLDGAGVEPRHLSLVADARGLVLAVRSGCQRVYVNARAVRERAFLRPGDSVTVGASRFLVTSDAAPPAVEEAAAGGDTGDVVLRVVSGAASGQALAVAPELHLGAGSRPFGELPYACRIARTGGRLVFESGSDLPRVNGWRRQRVVLAHNDQIVLGEHRLVVEAPGLEYARQRSSRPPPRPPAPPTPPEPVEAPPTEIWWLIAAALLLATIIALFLYFRW